MGKNKNWMKRQTKKILFSTSIPELTIEEDTVAFKEMKRVSHEDIPEVLDHVETGKITKTFGFSRLRRLR